MIIEHIKWYIEYIIDGLVHKLYNYIKSTIESLKKINTWFKIYGYTLFLLIVYYLIVGEGYVGDIFYGVVLLTIGLFIAIFYKNVSSGNYIHHHRNKYKEKIKDGVE